MYFYNGCNALSKKTLEAVKETNNDAVIAVKKNQLTLYCLAIIICHNNKCKDSYYQKSKKSHGRIESRKIEVFDVPEEFKNNDSIMKYASCIIKVTRYRKVLHQETKDGKNPSIKTHYHISTKKFTAKEFYKIIIGHWGIENRVNYLKDVSLKEDSSRIRKKANIFARLRSFALNIFRINKVRNIKFERFANSLHLNSTLNYVGII